MTKAGLNLANVSILAEINQQVLAGNVTNQGGEIISNNFSGLMLNPVEKIAYPVTKNIPQLLPELSISIQRLNLGNSVD